MNSTFNNFTNFAYADGEFTGNFIFKNNILQNVKEITSAPTGLTGYIDGNIYLS